ncbi:MAG: lipocalin-like domain-containing protein [Gammaproteobacteria bacterium]|nr:lipocalin-like domain-containing protein [Gammaproteobacteria bacterium]
MRLADTCLMVLMLMLTACRPAPESSAETQEITLSSRMGATPDAGFLRVTQPRAMIFPQDHGPHPEYATEWWYFTGNLTDTDEQPWGYQLTLFRVGLKPGDATEDSDWRSHQIIMGHFAISDIQARKHHSQERFSRLGVGLAGANTQPLRVWLGAWFIEAQSTESLFPLRLKADTEDFALDLELGPPDKPLVLQGDRGFSQKGQGQGNASYYYSYTRLPTSGTIRLDDNIRQVQGLSWFDREWSSSALAADQSGWDWFALQLTDGRDLMFYRLRDQQHRAQAFSRGVLVNKQGKVDGLNLDNTEFEIQGYWRNADGLAYPVNWRLQVPHQGIDLNISAVFPDQEMRHTVRYWEGAVRVEGSHQGKGYLELSGY